jgi:hypothetical protein
MFGLREIVGNRLTMGRIAKLALKLMGLDITYVSQTAIKYQALADFVAKWTETQQLQPPVTQEHWSMYFDGSFTLNSIEGGVVLTSPMGDRTPLCYLTALPHHQQYGRVRGPSNWSVHHH